MADERLRALERAALAGDRDAFVRLVARDPLGEIDGGRWTVRLAKRGKGKRGEFRTADSCLADWLVAESPWVGSEFALLPMRQLASYHPSYPPGAIGPADDYDAALTFPDVDDLLDFLARDALAWRREAELLEENELRRAEAQEIRLTELERERAAEDERAELRRQRAAVRSLQGKLARARAARKRASGKRLAAATALRRLDAELEARTTWPADVGKRAALAAQLAEHEARVAELAEKILVLAEEVKALP